MHLAEVAPAGGAAVVLEAMPYLFALALLYFALGGIKAVVYFVDFVIWIIRKTVGHIPFAGGAIEGLAKRGAAKLTNALGHAESGIDQYIGWCWHNLAHVVRWTIHVFERLSHQLLVNAIAARLHISRKQAAALIRAFLHPIRTLQWIERKLLHVLRNRALIVERTVVHGVYPRIRAGEAALEHVVEWDIPRLRARERILARRVERLWKWAHRHTKIALTGALVGAVAWALTKLGGRWIGCRNWRRIGKHVCGLPFNLIEDLLSVAADAFLLRNLCDLLPIIEATAREVAPVITELVLEVEGFICGGRKLAPSGIVASDWQRVASQASGIVASDLG